MTRACRDDVLAHFNDPSRPLPEQHIPELLELGLVDCVGGLSVRWSLTFDGGWYFAGVYVGRSDDELAARIPTNPIRRLAI